MKNYQIGDIIVDLEVRKLWMVENIGISIISIIDYSGKTRYFDIYHFKYEFYLLND